MVVAAAVLGVTRAAAAAPVVVFDFTTDEMPRAVQIGDAELRGVLVAFPAPTPSPRAKPTAPCDVQPRVTSVTGPLVPARPGSQTAYLLDYCPTASGPRPRRLVVQDGTATLVDRVLPAAVPADEVLAAVDVDGDGAAELVLTGDTMRGDRTRQTAYVVRPGARAVNLLGTWTAADHCVPGHYKEEQIGHRVTATGGTGGAKLVFHETSQARPCWYPPAPP